MVTFASASAAWRPPKCATELVHVLGRSPRVVPHLHLCLQSGSDRILAQMKRRYQSAGFLERCRRLRAALDEPAFSTDIIVGFPGETEQDFAETCHIVREVGFCKVHIFPYSRRTGTPAAAFREQVHPSIIEDRRQRLAEVEARIGSGILSEARGPAPECHRGGRRPAALRLLTRHILPPCPSFLSGACRRAGRQTGGRAGGNRGRGRACRATGSQSEIWTFSSSPSGANCVTIDGNPIIGELGRQATSPRDWTYYGPPLQTNRVLTITATFTACSCSSGNSTRPDWRNSARTSRDCWTKSAAASW